MSWNPRTDWRAGWGAVAVSAALAMVLSAGAAATSSGATSGQDGADPGRADNPIQQAQQRLFAVHCADAQKTLGNNDLERVGHGFRNPGCAILVAFEYRKRGQVDQADRWAKDVYRLSADPTQPTYPLIVFYQVAYLNAELLPTLQIAERPDATGQKPLTVLATQITRDARGPDRSGLSVPPRSVSAASPPPPPAAILQPSLGGGNAPLPPAGADPPPQAARRAPPAVSPPSRMTSADASEAMMTALEALYGKTVAGQVPVVGSPTGAVFQLTQLDVSVQASVSSHGAQQETSFPLDVYALQTGGKHLGLMIGRRTLESGAIALYRLVDCDSSGQPCRLVTSGLRAAENILQGNAPGIVKDFCDAVSGNGPDPQSSADPLGLTVSPVARVEPASPGAYADRWGLGTPPPPSARLTGAVPARPHA